MKASVLGILRKWECLGWGALGRFPGAELASRLAQSGEAGLAKGQGGQSRQAALEMGAGCARAQYGKPTGLAGRFGVYRQPGMDTDPSFWVSVALHYSRRKTA